MDFSHIHALFKDSHSVSDRYETIIELGRALPPFAESDKIPENRVVGCQSELFLKAELVEGRLFFQAWSDALISAGLAALLLVAYKGFTPLELLQTPPIFLKDLDIFASLSPSRSNGLGSLVTKMRQEALRLLPQSAVPSL